MADEKHRSEGKPEDGRPKEGVVSKVAETATAIGLAAATAASGGALAAAIVAGTPTAAGLVGRAYEKWRKRKQRQMEQLWHEIVAGDLEFEAHIEAALEADHDAIADVIIRALREVLDSTAPEAMKPLARLARQYLRSGKSADRLFRGAAQVLSRATADVLQDLRIICRLALEADLEERDEFVSLVTRRPKLLPSPMGVEGAPRDSTARFVGQNVMRKVLEDGHEVGQFTFVAMIEAKHAREVFALLKAASIGLEGQGGMDGNGGPDDLYVVRHELEWLGSLLEVEKTT
jgi:hypothetical protein